MASIFYNILSPEDLEYIRNLPEVREAKGSFTIELTDSIRVSLASMGIDLSTVNRLPMRWIHADTPAHVDTGSSEFEKTFLVYLNDSTGEFILGTDSYPITENTAFVFNEGILHKTVGTESRLLIGPMNEFADPVGAVLQAVNYFPTDADAFGLTNVIAIQNFGEYSIGNPNGYVAWAIETTNTVSLSYSSTRAYRYTETLTPDRNIPGDNLAQYYLYPVFLVYYESLADALSIYSTQLGNSTISYTLNTVNGYSNWRIASNSTGTSSQNSVYSASTTLTTGGTYFLYPAPVLIYYANQANALAGTSQLGSSLSSYSLTTVGGFSSWRIASNSTGSSSQAGVYTSGTALTSDGYYYLYPVIPCFLEGTQILCQVAGQDTYVSIESIQAGDLVKTSQNGYKSVVLVGNSQLENTANDERIENRLYKCTPSKYPELTHDLYITGCHSILVNPITDIQKEKTITSLGKLFVTDGKYRLMACIDERAEPWNSEGTYTIWNLSLENENIHSNYGIWANGLLVESCSINFLKNRSNMKLI